jgi:sugar lactone lactonase YvrE
MNAALSANLSRRLLLALPCVLSGCAWPTSPPVPARPRPEPGQVALVHGRSISGGFLRTAPGVPGVPAVARVAAFQRLVAPTALALLEQELLVADSGTGRLWRIDLGLGAFVPQPGVAVLPTTALALAPDRTAWLLDGPAAQVRRLADDGRVIQTYRLGGAVAPAGLALADLGTSVLVADAGASQWHELRAGSAQVISVRPQNADGRPIGVDAVAVSGDRVWVLDRRAGRVHRVGRDGQVQTSLGDGVLKQPVALAADAMGRVWVLDALDHSVKLLREARPVQVFDAAALRLRQPAAIATDGHSLAVADRVGGQVAVLRVEEGRS